MNQYRILLVDDDECILSSLKDWMEMNGHKVVCAESADEVVWMSNWQWVDFDCVITGINQPGLRGIDFTNMVRATGGPPVIIMSGYQPENVDTEALAAGAAAFLKKPVSFQKFLEVVESVVGNLNRSAH